MIDWKVEKRRIGDLVPADYNPRKLSEKQREDLEKSLKKFGLAEIPVINLNNNIIAGHQRIKILADLYGEDYEIDVRVPSRLLTINEEKEYNIRSNKNTGDWDFDKLITEFDKDELVDWGFEEWEIPEDSFDLSDEDLVDKNREDKQVKKVCPNCGYEL